MGLFGSTKVYVSSTVENMAGDEADRVDYLKTVTVSAVVSDQPSIVDTVRQSLISGPGIKLRNFFNWSLDSDNYGIVGVPGQTLHGAIDLDGDTIATEITAVIGKNCTVQSSSFGYADYSQWCDQYMLANHPDLIDTAWVGDISETGVITITFADSSIYSWTPSDFEKDKMYIYANYIIVNGASEGTVTEGEVVDIGSGDFPSISGYTIQSDTTTVTSETLTTTVVTTYTYSDDTPESSTTTTSTSTGDGTSGTKIYDKTTYLGSTETTDGSTQNKIDIYNQFYTYSVGSNTTTTVTHDDIGGGVTRTTTVVTTSQIIVVDNSYRMDTRIDTLNSWTGPYIYIYQYQSGNATLDAMIVTEGDSTDKEFFPYIPIRLNNEYVEQIDSDAYTECVAAFKKSVGGKLHDVQDDLDKSANIADIDYAYAVFGCCLNVTDNSCKKYIYNFLVRLMENQNHTLTDYSEWKVKMDAYQTALTAWITWKDAQSDSTNALFGTDEPTVPTYPVIPSTSINIGSNGEFTDRDGVGANYNILISWQTIAQTSGTGLAKADATVGELWWDQIGTDSIEETIFLAATSNITRISNVDHGRLYWQTSADTWTAMDVYGFQHQNFIYAGKSVDTGFFDALNDTGDTGFIIPLHAPTYKAMSLVDMTQMSTACTFLVFNCYEVVKTGLLGSLIFKIFLIVVIVAIVVFAPQLAPQLAAMAASTGAALGLSGVTALIVGAAINAVAGMIVASLLNKALVAVFGAKIGSIIGAVLAVATVVYSVSNGFSNFNNISTQLMRADNIMKLTSAIGGGIDGVLKAMANDKLAQIATLTSNYNSEMSALNTDYQEYVGYDKGYIDPLLFTDTGVTEKSDGTYLVSSTYSQMESMDSFLQRTLMTGNDIVDFTNYMITNFTDYSLSTKLP